MDTWCRLVLSRHTLIYTNTINLASVLCDTAIPLLVKYFYHRLYLYSIVISKLLVRMVYWSFQNIVQVTINV